MNRRSMYLQQKMQQEKTVYWLSLIHISYEYEFARYEQAPSDVQEKEVAARAE